MKNARVSLWNAKPSQNPKAPILNGSVQLPAQLVWELFQQLQAGQGLERDEQTGDQFFKLRLSVWQGSGENNGPILNGTIESPAERAAYLATQQQAQPWSLPNGQGAAPAGPPAPVAPPAPGWTPAAPAAPAAPPAYAPPAAPPAPPAAPAWGGGGWGA